MVIFDIYKTLIDLQTDEAHLDTYRFLANWLSYKGLPLVEPRALRSLYRETVTQALAANPEPYPDVEIGLVFAQMVDTIGRGGDPPSDVSIEEIALLFRILTTKSIRVYPEVIPTLETLRSQTRLAIVSNTQRLFTLPELKKFGLEQYFEYILCSSDVQSLKPGRKIFETLLREVDIRPEQAVYVGNDLHDDVWGAQQMGMQAVWIDRRENKAWPPDLQKPTPDRRVPEDQAHTLAGVILAVSDSSPGGPDSALRRSAAGGRPGGEPCPCARRSG